LIIAVKNQSDLSWHAVCVLDSVVSHFAESY